MGRGLDDGGGDGRPRGRARPTKHHITDVDGHKGLHGTPEMEEAPPPSYSTSCSGWRVARSLDENPYLCTFARSDVASTFLQQASGATWIRGHSSRSFNHAGRHAAPAQNAAMILGGSAYHRLPVAMALFQPRQEIQGVMQSAATVVVPQGHTACSKEEPTKEQTIETSS